ncbi:hypothetical protein JB92DRAFT_1485195 [Gautieria morchelliformis]|nr:hypothetical protein JB92DRAFT_1485195 [Gautieria morchelliformis]
MKSRGRRRPRRMVRKIAGVESLAKQLVPTPLALDNNSEEEKHQSGSAPPTRAEIKDGGVLKVTEKSDSSERRSSSTLLDTDAVENKNKNKKRAIYHRESKDILPAKRQRVSRRIYVQKHPDPQEEEASPVAEHTVRTQSSLSELTPTPEPQIATNISKAESREDGDISSPSPPPRSLRKTVVKTSHSVPEPDSPSRSLASRPGHRVNRDHASSQAHPEIPTHHAVRA